MGNREEFFEALHEMMKNDPDRVARLVVTTLDRMEVLRTLADSSMEVGVVLAWPAGYPIEVRERAAEFSVNALKELDEILNEALEGDEDE